MVSHKKRKFSLILLGLLLFTILTSFQITNVLAQSTVNYNFNGFDFNGNLELVPEANGFSSMVKFNSYSGYNITETYNGTYSFTYEIDDTRDTDIDFIDSVSSVPDITYATITPELDGHSKLIEIVDGDTSSIIETHDLDNPQSFGSYEFWVNTEDASYYNVLLFMDGVVGDALFLFIYNERFAYSGTGGTDFAEALDDTWYHISVDFETTAGGYLGLSDDRWQIRINGHQYGEFQFNGNPTSFDTFELQSASTQFGYSFFIDAIGFNWEGDYDIGDNLIPYRIFKGESEIKGYTFLNYENGNFTNYQDTLIPFFDVTSGTPYIDVYADDYRGVRFTDWNTATEQTIERELTITDEQEIWIMFDGVIGAINAGSTTHYRLIELYSSDDTLIFRGGWRGVNTINFEAWNGASWDELETGISDNDDFSLQIGVIGDNIIISYAYVGNYIVEKLDTSKTGLGKIIVNVYSSGAETSGWITWVDTLGVWINGSSACNDGFITLGGYLPDTRLIGLNSDYDFSLILNNSYSGSTSIGLANDWGESFSEITTYSSSAGLDTQQSIRYIIDSNGEWEAGDVNSLLLMSCANKDFTISNVDIHQYNLSSGSDFYFPTLSDGSIDGNTSYFYVDSSNRLRFSLFVDDNESEFIQAIFNIPDRQTENYSVSFLSNIDGGSLGFFRVMYTDDRSTFIPFPTWLTTTNLILPQTKEIGSIGILITDNDADDNDYTYGFISNLQLTHISGMGVQIITLNLMMVIVPIMVMLVPTFGISARYGKSTIIPVFILMSIICFATGLIPTWLFFVIMLSAGAFLFMKRKKEGG